LTNSPYAFKARPWELKANYSIDTLDPILPVVQVDSRGAEIMRVLPRVHEDVNEEWISDKTRHAFDGVKRQRLSVPLVKDANGNLVDCSWEVALEKVAEAIGKVRPNQVVSMIGDQADVESIVALRDLFLSMGIENLEFKAVCIHI
jgi:NADH dehydrogenase (ubiquinone) Fe-S protein 1